MVLHAISLTTQVTQNKQHSTSTTTQLNSSQKFEVRVLVADFCFSFETRDTCNLFVSMDTSSPVVCHIPDCATTQAEIEVELKAFLTGYCSICKKAREGKLCGCAFPCSLNFRAQMMAKIHQLLHIPQPPDRRFIQVSNNIDNTHEFTLHYLSICYLHARCASSILIC